FQIMDSLSPTDVEFGSVATLGLTTNGIRDPILYMQHVRPQIFVPLHMTDVQLVSSSLQSKKSLYLTQQAAEGSAEIPDGGVVYKPELRWMVDPDDFARPMVFYADDQRWHNPAKDAGAAKVCHGGGFLHQL
ncbi:MAG TPA: hypothetical protein VL993_00085, partial [Stellaceae bacterium]|nr:hypothetical protein [Stellaceae bacterium]